MNTFLQLLNRIGDGFSMANIGNQFELERLMRARREDDLALTNNGREGNTPMPCPPAVAPRAFAIARPVGSVKGVKESMA